MRIEKLESNPQESGPFAVDFGSLHVASLTRPGVDGNGSY